MTETQKQVMVHYHVAADNRRRRVAPHYYLYWTVREAWELGFSMLRELHLEHPGTVFGVTVTDTEDEPIYNIAIEDGELVIHGSMVSPSVDLDYWRPLHEMFLETTDAELTRVSGLPSMSEAFREACGR